MPDSLRSNGLLPRALAITVGTLLLLLGSAYLVKGTFHMFTNAGDYQLRWTESHYIFRGKSPTEVWRAREASERGLPAPITRRDASMDPDLGPTYGAYPPWAYAITALVTWPTDLRVGRVLNGVASLALLALVLLWAHQLGRVHSRQHGALFALSVLATSSVCSTFGVGNYGVLVLAALLGAFRLEQRQRWLGAGLLMGIALTKVTLSAPFLIPLVLLGRLRTVAVALSYVAVATIPVALAIDTNPISMLSEVFQAAENYAGSGYSLVDGLLELGLDTNVAMKGAALASLSVATIVCWLWRSAALDVHWAVAATTARLWSYHNPHDNLIMVILLLAFGTRLQTARAAWIGFVLVGLTVWAPARACELPAFRVLQLVAWPACTALLLWLTPRRAPVPVSVPVQADA
jgi:hypothetical protein